MNYKAFVFDAYGTLFDVHSVAQAIQKHFPNKGSQISEVWRSSQVHYFMVRQLIGGYVPFDELTRWALYDALSKNDVEPHEETISTLMKQYEHLSPFEEVRDLQKHYPHHNLTIFSNGTKSMLEPLLENNQLSHFFSLLSADEPKVYKPHREAYAYAQKQLNVGKEEILFFSSNPWDIAGATQFGFHTAWVNRQNQKWPELGIKPSYIIKDLNEIPE
ncbi:haloacid dehalogenase type II [Halobacillus sp. B23F22_1]|uniref:haloacid dehalogenase type II n=1 Tax=Halobacillus sp. B23F22_1 TaxID=3459514 RepID=UPI00373F6B41